MAVGIKVLISNCKERFPMYTLKFGIIFLYTFVVSTLWSIIFLFRPRDVRNMKHIQPMTNFLARVLGLNYEIDGVQYFDKDKSYVIILNHQSYLDVLPLMNIAKHMDVISIVAKKALLYAWPVGLCSWLIGVTFIERKNPEKAYQAISDSKNILRKHKTCKFLFFPEGTRNQDAAVSGALLPFKKGAFKFAIENQMPILPVVNSPYYFLRKERNKFGKGDIRTEILKPISTCGLSEADVDELVKKTHTLMQSKFTDMFKWIKE